MGPLDRMMGQAKAQGVNPAAECTAAGMDICLHTADNLSLVVYKSGMAEDWLASMSLWCRQNRRHPMAFQEVAAAILQLSVDSDSGFIRPKQVWSSISAYRARQIKAALHGAHGPAIPSSVAGDPAREIAYRRAWIAYAGVCGNAQQAEQQARGALGLPEKDEPRQIAMMPPEVREKMITVIEGMGE